MILALESSESSHKAAPVILSSASSPSFIHRNLVNRKKSGAALHEENI